MKTTAGGKYQAFISYSHASDSKLAPAVQTALRRFGKQWYSPSSVRVFRDETALGLTPDLFGEIQKRLEQSECFILVASPGAAQSEWVKEEIQFWIQHPRGKPLLLLLAGGTIRWSKDQRDFDWDQTNALPRTLQGVFKDEPLWADLSWAKTDADRSLRNPRFFVEVAKLVAGMRQVPLETVFDEAAVHQQKALRLLWATVTTLALVTVVAVGAASVSFRLAAEKQAVIEAEKQRQREAAERLRKEAASIELAAKAAAVLTDDRELSTLLALEAVAIAHTREAERALRQTLLELVPPLVLEGHSDTVYNAQFSADGRRVLTSSGDGSVRLWDPATGTNLQTFQVITESKSADRASGILSRDGTKVLTLGAPAALDFGYWQSSGYPKLYDATTGALLTTISNKSVVNASLSPDNSRIATAGFDTTAIIWDARTGQSRFELAGHRHRVASISFSSNGNWLVTASWDGSARVWDGLTGGNLAALQMPKGKRVDLAAFSPDGTRVITVGDGEKEVLIWDWRGRPGDPVASFTGHEGSIQDLALSADGRWLATAGVDKTARIWEAATGKCQHILSGHLEFVNGIDFSPDCRWVVTASGDTTAQVWDAATGENVMQLGWNHFPRTCLVFSPDGLRIMTGTTAGAVPIYTYAILGGIDKLDTLARASVRRTLTPEEKQKYLPASPTR